MADTFTQIYIQVVFAVRSREGLIQPEWEDDLFKYVTGIVKKKGQKMLAINGTKDHIHFFLGMKPACCLSDLIREVKKSTVAYIKEQEYIKSAFYWQEGFGAFSYSHSHLDKVIRYINNQKEHHQTKTFKEEYKALLDAFNVEYKNEYLFDWVE